MATETLTHSQDQIGECPFVKDLKCVWSELCVPEDWEFPVLIEKHELAVSDAKEKDEVENPNCLVK